MRIKIFYPNAEGKIEFSPEELERLLNDTYDEGREDGVASTKPYIWSPVTTPTPYWPVIYNTGTGAPVIDPNITVWCTDDDAMGRITLSKTELGEYTNVIGNDQ